MKYKILKFPNTGRPLHECGYLRSKEFYQAHVVIHGDVLYKNHSEFTEEEIRLITNDFKNMDMLNYSDIETVTYLQKQTTKNYKYILI